MKQGKISEALATLCVCGNEAVASTVPWFRKIAIRELKPQSFLASPLSATKGK